MTEGGRLGNVIFRPRARLLKLIGEELISDEVVAVMELVKNAHDADASSVTLHFRGVTGEGGEIIVEDDGCGLDLETLFKRWMEPASPAKTQPGERKTLRGRRVLGEKGVGRFATDKLARGLELVSRVVGEKDEIRAVFDWDAFDSTSAMLSEIEIPWEMVPARQIPEHGTLLRMTGLRTTWTERMFRRLCTRLGRLVSPFDGLSHFTIRIESDEFPRYAGELRPDLLDRAPYRVEAFFDGREGIVISVNGRSQVEHHWNGQGELQCGPVRTRIYAFDLETDAIARIGPRIEVRAWLREWSGVSVYRDGFRIWPYGEPHDDWLRLDQRRVNNPVVRLSNNQIVGFVEIGNDRNPELKDQTNREGLIHNRAFADLRRLIHFVLQILEAERQAIRHPGCRRGSSGSSIGSGNGSVGDRDAIPETLERLAGRANEDIAADLRRVAARTREAFDADATQQRRFVEGYSDLAALGQAAIGLHLAVKPLLEEIVAQCSDVRMQLNGKGSRPLVSSLRSVEDLAGTITARIAMLAAMETGAARRRRAIDVPSEVETCRNLLEPVLRAASVEMMIDAPRRGVLRVEMRPESFARLIHILTMNALDWLHGVDRPRIRVAVNATEERCEILFSDNGPGIPAEIAQRVFEPLFSCKEGGRGMGLTIARHIVTLHGGAIELLTDRRRTGANLRILLPRKRSRATIHGR